MGGHSPVMTHRERTRYRAPFFCLLFFGKDVQTGDIADRCAGTWLTLSGM